MHTHKKHISFVQELDALLKKYNAGLFYTSNDDGLHIAFEAKEPSVINIGWSIGGAGGDVEEILANMPDEHGNTEVDPMRYCCFPDCGCDGSRLCMAKEGPNASSCAMNIERGSLRL